MMIVLERLGIIRKSDVGNTVNSLAGLREQIKKDVPLENNPAKRIAAKINGIPLIYGHAFLAAAARRWRQQLNENAKMIAFDFSLPEANHNELMSWEEMVKNERSDETCILLRHRNEDIQIRKRFDFMEEIYRKNAGLIKIFAEGKDDLSRLMYAVYLGDYISNYLAVLRNVDPTPVGLIQELKKRL